MELLKLVRRRSFLSEVLYVCLNVALALLLLASIAYTQSIVLGLILVLVSKWRVFAVRPRFWFANIQANLVDVIVSISFVLNLYAIDNAGLSTGGAWVGMGLLTLLYIAWLLFLKPRSKRAYMVAQSGVALFFGVMTLFSVSYEWPVSVVVLGMWLIGYATARHTLSSYDDEDYIMLLTMSWGVVLAEIGWLAYHWTIAYTLPFASNLVIPQIAILAIMLAFVAHRAYDSFYHHQKIRSSDVLMPIIFVVSLTIVLLVFLPLILCHSVDCTSFIIGG